MGYKLKVGDEKLMGKFETLCAFHTPIDSIATQLGVCSDTLKTWVYQTYHENFAFVYQRYMEGGNSLVNQASTKLMFKDAKMNIWLRKQWLHEKDPDKEIVSKNEEVDIEERPDVFDEIAKRLAGGK